VDVEIWSDIACPWCYIGKRRFEAALAEFEHRDDVRVTWRSFELDPSAPHEREGDHATRIAEKYGITVERAKEMGRTVTDAAATLISTSSGAAPRSTATASSTSPPSTGSRTR
jgi:predicted DsbA family dithiol-disulfide isomerase